jgi:CheY-like chemotaxis protein
MIERVLIADDNPWVRQSLDRLLCSLQTPSPITVDTVCDGVEALHATTQHTYDLVLVDMAMPNLSGLDVIERLRGSGFTGKIVLMTGQHQAWIATRASILGATNTLFKPLDPDEVMDLVMPGAPVLEEEPLADDLDWLTAIALAPA